MRNHSRKGQSAIEYLTTYGWALLAIIIVGAVLVNMGVFSQCQTTTPRFSGQNVAIDSWSFTGTNSMSMTVQALQQDVTVTDIDFDWNGDGTYEDANGGLSLTVSAGNTNTTQTDLSVPSLTSGECAGGDVRITYNVTGGADGAIATGSGTLSGPVP